MLSQLPRFLVLLYYRRHDSTEVASWWCCSTCRRRSESYRVAVVGLECSIWLYRSWHLTTEAAVPLVSRAVRDWLRSLIEISRQVLRDGCVSDIVLSLFDVPLVRWLVQFCLFATCLTSLSYTAFTVILIGVFLQPLLMMGHYESLNVSHTLTGGWPWTHRRWKPIRPADLACHSAAAHQAP